MPEAKLVFYLPEEQSEFEVAIHSLATAGLVHEADQVLRTYLKHGEPTLENAIKAIQEAREILAGAIEW